MSWNRAVDPTRRPDSQPDARESGARRRPRVDDVLAGLRAPRKHLPCRLLYDARGAALFEQICTLEDYYPTRSELALLAQHLPAIASAAGPAVRVIEPGSGAGLKTRMLLRALDRPVGYVPIDISREQLEDNASALRAELPDLDVQPVFGDYTGPLAVPPPPRPAARTLAFFPGSTIGNFEPDEARGFLARLVDLAGPAGLLLLGADSNSDRASIERAYNDREGVTAAFNLNVLAHLNRAREATFDLAAFEHRAVWNAAGSRIEMHLFSRHPQTVLVDGEPISFEEGESIVTEHCYKHSRPALAALLASAGWRVLRIEPDPRARMHLWLAAAERR